MRKLYFIIFVVGSIAGIGCSDKGGGTQYVPVPTASTITQGCTAKDANGNCLGGPATVVSNPPGTPPGTPGTPGGTPAVHVAKTNTTTGVAAQKLANAIHTTYNLNNNGSVTANTGSGGSGGSFRVSNNSVQHTGMGTESFTGGEANGNIAANGDPTNGNTAAVGFHSFVQHEEIDGSTGRIISGGNGAGVGGDSGTGGRTDSGTGAGQ